MDNPQIVSIILSVGAVLIAAIITPFASYRFTAKLAEKHRKEDLKLRIFSELMAGRCESENPDIIKFLNLIDVVFHDDSKVRNAWAKYYNYLSDIRLNDAAGGAIRDNSKLDLLAAMSESVGKIKHISNADLARIYMPTFIAEQEEIAFHERQYKLATYRSGLDNSVKPSSAHKESHEAKNKVIDIPIPERNTVEGKV